MNIDTILQLYNSVNSEDRGIAIRLIAKMKEDDFRVLAGNANKTGSAVKVMISRNIDYLNDSFMGGGMFIFEKLYSKHIMYIENCGRIYIVPRGARQTWKQAYHRDTKFLTKI